MKKEYVSYSIYETLKQEFLPLYKKTPFLFFQFRKDYKNLYQKIQNFNIEYLKNKEKECNDFLSNIKGYSLDKEQREVVLSEEENTLEIGRAHV